MDPDSPFRAMNEVRMPMNRTIHVNFCDVCHHVWKAPAAATVCINCKGNGESARSLASYVGDVPINV